MKATVILTKEAQPRGEYKPTLIDEQKHKADMLIESIDGDYYTINTKGKEIKAGRGVIKYSNGFYAVTECVLNKLRKQYTIEMNF